MKRNVLATMQRLGIDAGIQGLVRQLWKHNYRTGVSCQGGGAPHDDEAYIAFRAACGDGWAEKNLPRYGLRRVANRPCCADSPAADAFCKFCGAGKSGITTYRGPLVNPYQSRTASTS